jgi:hypothetical protein
VTCKIIGIIKDRKSIFKEYFTWKERYVEIRGDPSKVVMKSHNASNLLLTNIRQIKKKMEDYYRGCNLNINLNTLLLDSERRKLYKL